MPYSFPKIEHLVRKEHFDALHEQGAFIKAFPFSLRYMEMPLEDAVKRKVAIIAEKGVEKSGRSQQDEKTNEGTLPFAQRRCFW